MPSSLHSSHGDLAFTVDITEYEQVMVVRAAGELDLAAEPLLGATFAQVEETGLPILVDMTEATFCASCILGLLMETARRLTGTGAGPLVVASE